MIELSGVRSSCDTLARNSLLRRLDSARPTLLSASSAMRTSRLSLALRSDSCTCCISASMPSNARESCSKSSRVRSPDLAERSPRCTRSAVARSRRTGEKTSFVRMNQNTATASSDATARLPRSHTLLSASCLDANALARSMITRARGGSLTPASEARGEKSRNRRSWIARHWLSGIASA